MWSQIQIKYLPNKLKFDLMKCNEKPRNKAKKILGWEVKSQLEEGIKKTISWIKQNPWWLEQKI